MQMPLLSLKNDRLPLLFESEDPEEEWKLFCELQNTLPKALFYEGFELSHCQRKQNKLGQKCFIAGTIPILPIFEKDAFTEIRIFPIL